MGIIKRQSLKSSIVNYIGVALGVVFFNFVFTHLVDKEHLGLINLLRSLMFVLSAFPALGFAHVLLRYFSVWKNDEFTAHYNAFAIRGTWVALAIFSLLLVVGKNFITQYYEQQSSLFLPYYYVLIPLVICYTLTQYYELFSLVKLRAAVPTALREVLSRALLIVVFYMYIYHIINETGLVWGFVISLAIPFIILWIYVSKVLHFKTGDYRKYYQYSQRKTEMQYGIGMYALVVFTNIHNFLDGIILPAYLGLSALAIYTPALVLGQMIQIPYRSISLISIPILREAIVERDFVKLQTLSKDLALNLFLIGCMLFTLLICSVEGIFNLLPPDFAQGKYVLYIIATGRLFDMAFGLNSEILNYSSQYKRMIVLSVAMMLCTIVLNIILLPIYGLQGAALSVSISLILYNIGKSFLIYKYYHFHCFSYKYIPIAIVTTVVIIIMNFVPYLTFFNHHMFVNACCNVVFKAFLASILFILPIVFLKVSPDLNHFLKILFHGKLFKGGHKMNEL